MLLFGLAVRGTPAVAQTMTEVDRLSFGTFAIISNSGVKTITVAPDNSTVYDPAIVADVEAQRGHYTLSGMPANVTFTLGVSISNPPNDGGLMLDNPTNLTTGGGEHFQLINFTVNSANEVVTDGLGDADMFIGATLRTTGNGNIYNDGAYNGTYDITFFY